MRVGASQLVLRRWPVDGIRHRMDREDLVPQAELDHHGVVLMALAGPVDADLTVHAGDAEVVEFSVIGPPSATDQTGTADASGAPAVLRWRPATYELSLTTVAAAVSSARTTCADLMTMRLLLDGTTLEVFAEDGTLVLSASLGDFAPPRAWLAARSEGGRAVVNGSMRTESRRRAPEVASTGGRRPVPTQGDRRA